jgi:hypothetical protein
MTAIGTVASCLTSVFARRVIVLSSSSLALIEIPRNIEILGQSCCQEYKSFALIAFESDSRLDRIETQSFSDRALEWAEIPRNAEIVGSSYLVVIWPPALVSWLLPNSADNDNNKKADNGHKADENNEYVGRCRRPTPI